MQQMFSGGEKKACTISVYKDTEHTVYMLRVDYLHYLSLRLEFNSILEESRLVFLIACRYQMPKWDIFT